MKKKLIAVLMIGLLAMSGVSISQDKVESIQKNVISSLVKE